MTNHLQTELGRSWMTWCNRFAIQKHTRPDTVQLHLAFASYRIGKVVSGIDMSDQSDCKFRLCSNQQRAWPPHQKGMNMRRLPNLLDSR